MPDASGASIPKNLGSLLWRTVRRFPQKKALFWKEQGRYQSISWAQTADRVASAAGWIRSKGLKRGERLAILSENRPEWAFVDLAAQCLGVVTVPIYTSLTPAEIAYLLKDSGAKALAVSGKTLLEKVVSVRGQLPALECVLAFDASSMTLAQALGLPMDHLIDIDKRGSSLSASELEALAGTEAGPDDLATLIYTSGTTGVPKGAMLTHGNFVHNALLCERALRMGETDAHLSFLPLSHVFERTAGYYLMIHIGASIAYAESMDTVPQNLIETSPTFILGVPRFYEKIQAKALEALRAAGPFRKGLFFWALETGKQRRLSGFGPMRLKDRVASALVYSKFRRKLGGRVRFGVSGGAALSKEVAEFFADLGVIILEGYGLTETSPVISANREGRFKFGSVGIPLEGIQVRIAEDGELLTAGPCVMKGYWNKPSETDAALEDGWFHTGDLATIDRDGFLTITGRKKELIVTSGGKKVASRAVEELIEKDPLVMRCVLFGEGRKYLTAVIVPDKRALEEYAASQKIASRSYQDLLADSKVYQFLEQRVADASKDLASYERIKYFVLRGEDFTQAAGELTPTLKVKRDVVYAHHQQALERLYQKDGPV